MKSLRTFFVLAASLAAGCLALAVVAGADEEEKKPARKPKKDEVTVQVLDHDGLKELLAGHEGKVVVMDCWSTWCEPCVREFPNLVKIHRKYGGKQVACVSLCFDHDGVSDLETEVKPPVLEFLQKEKATFDNVLASDPDDEYRQWDFPAVPAVLVFGRDGKLAKLFHSSQGGSDPSYDDINAFVEELAAAE